MYSSGLRCVFVHVPRTGGTSVALALARYFDDAVWKPDGSLDPDHRSLQEQCQLRGLDPADVMSFAFVRNPWDRYVSFYEFYHGWFLHRQSSADAGNDPRLANSWLSFDDWLRRFISAEPDNLLRPSAQLVRGVSCVGRFERLQESFDAISRQLGLPHQRLPAVNQSLSRQPYRSYYTPALRDLVAELERELLLQFGYTF